MPFLFYELAMTPWLLNWSQTVPADFAAFKPTTQDADLLKQVGFLPGVKELLILRQVHALEHATVWLLSQDSQRYPDTHLAGGMSTEKGFYLYGQVKVSHLRQAASEALRRLNQGEWALAIHPECGTNLSVAILLGFGLTLGLTTWLPKSPLAQILGVGMAAAAATQLTPSLGSLTQRHLTTAIPFNLALQDITLEQDLLGRPAHFVGLTWVEQ